MAINTANLNRETKIRRAINFTGSNNIAPESRLDELN